MKPNDCVPRDDLLGVIAALERPILPSLDHLADCDRCRGELATLVEIRELLGGEDPLPARFVDQVMTRIEEAAADEVDHAASERAERMPPRWRATRLHSIANSALFALVVGAALAVVLMTRPAPAAPAAALSTSAHLLVGLFAAVALTWWEFGRSATEV